ncbi:hypothetical protein [Vibrio rumoiensis]|uniref:hypothetical protein n=1 Tax=Vibrio rumoiensis TaxID=76258 RepID=UPI000B5CF4D5|nr:hypothetical protein [Vibrio rumoiensis]
MKLKLFIPFILLATSTAYAGLIKPDCDASKVAKNAALENTVGISGRCDAAKTAEQAKDEAVDNVSDKVDQKRDKLADTKDKVLDKKSKISDDVKKLKDEPVKTVTEHKND